MTGIPLDLRPSLLYAGIAVGRSVQERGGTAEEARRHLLQGEAFFSSLDYDGAFLIAETMGWDVFSNRAEDKIAFRDSIENLVLEGQPPWALSIPVGRDYVRQTLDEDAWQCFVLAGLTDTSPETVAWWDRLAMRTRNDVNDRQLQAGREAERKSFDRESSILASTGLAPSWVALDDNHAGYDIKSWRLQEAVPAGTFDPLFVEVKGSVSGREIHFTRREWQVAAARAAHWEMQVWTRIAEEPMILRHIDLEPHIPKDVGGGRWEAAVITIEMIGRAEPQPRST